MSKLTIEVTESNGFSTTYYSTLSDFLEEHKSSFSEDNVRNLYRNLFPCVAKLASKQIALFIT
jgi:hypothetical protein